ncbi:MAG: hypothetical protein EXQ73_00420 [Candidatus Nanopelagicaceae bacterium]|nr:hypothetical protein [Candidatus Nanopelagicaceae bacterium]
MAKQFIYPFTFGDKSKSDLLGGKGANLAALSPAPHLECQWQDLNLVEQSCLRVKSCLRLI